MSNYLIYRIVESILFVGFKSLIEKVFDMMRVPFFSVGYIS